MTTTADKPSDEFDALRTVIQTLVGFSPDVQRWILRQAAEKSGIAIAGADTANTNSELGTVVGEKSGGNKPDNIPVDIKTFTQSKNPKNDVQFATVVAYYHRFEAKEEERKASINGDDLEDACRKVVWSRPKRPSMTLVNAAAAGLLDKVGNGSYEINAVGENLVAITLPGGSEAVTNNKPIRKKKPTKKKTATQQKPSRKKK